MKKTFFPKEKTYIAKLFLKFFQFFQSLFWPKKNSRKFLGLYLLAIFVGAGLLLTPYALAKTIKTNGEAFTFIDALFTSTSAFSDTGLVVTQTAQQFTLFGKIIIMLLILFGGIGIMSIKIIVFTLIGKKLGLKDKILISDERGSSKVGETTELIFSAFKTIFAGVIFGVIALAPYFYFVKQEGVELTTFHNLGKSIWYALFHSVSAINNAGFDIVGGSSFLPFANDIWPQLVFIILIIIGGIGFPVIHDVKRFIKHKFSRKQAPFKWSLFTKLTVITYFIVFVIGLSFTVFLELFSKDPNSLWTLALQGKAVSSGKVFTQSEVLNGMIFSVFSTRNAGFSTIPVHLFQDSTRLVWSILMWIGSSPASTAGGIRTTTIAIVVLSVISAWKGSNRVFVLKHRIPRKTVFNSFLVLLTSLGLIVTAVIIMLLDAENASLATAASGNYVQSIIFEASSAFGTTGLSTGITPSLGPISLIVIIVLMIFGQLGISSALSITSPNKKIDEDSEVLYGEEDVIIS